MPAPGREILECTCMYGARLGLPAVRAQIGVGFSFCLSSSSSSPPGLRKETRVLPSFLSSFPFRSVLHVGGVHSASRSADGVATWHFWTDHLLASMALSVSKMDFNNKALPPERSRLSSVHVHGLFRPSRPSETRLPSLLFYSLLAMHLARECTGFGLVTTKWICRTDEPSLGLSFCRTRKLFRPADPSLISPPKRTLDTRGWYCHHAAVPGLLARQHLKEVGAQETGRRYGDQSVQSSLSTILLR